MTPAQLKTLRQQLGLTQEQLGAKLRVDRNTINRWEMGLYPVDQTAAELLTILSGSILGGGRKMKKNTKAVDKQR